MSGELPSLVDLRALGPQRAAALWLERLQRDEAAADGVVFQQWLDADEANRRAWDRATELWNLLDEGGEDEFGALRREALAFRVPRALPVWIGYAAAACIALAVLAMTLLRPNLVGIGPAERQLASVPSELHRGAPSHYSTPVGQRSTVTLGDGSRIILDSDSAIDVTYRDGQRLARLVRGQAFFEVAHDATHPFRVAAGGRIVSVLGTRFNVRLSSRETRIVLVEGAIGVSRGDDPARPTGGEIARLGPGQQLIARDGRPDQITPVEVERQIRWRDGFVQFDDDPLSEAVEEMNRYSESKLIIGDQSIADLRVSGAFQAGDMDGFAETLSALYPVRVVATGRGDRRIERR